MSSAPSPPPVGTVNKVGADYLGLLVLGFINAAIAADHIRLEFRPRLAVRSCHHLLSCCRVRCLYPSAVAVCAAACGCLSRCVLLPVAVWWCTLALLVPFMPLLPLFMLLSVHVGSCFSPSAAVHTFA